MPTPRSSICLMDLHRLSFVSNSAYFANFCKTVVVVVVVVVVDFIDRNEKASRETNKTHCCQVAKIQQTLIKVQSHKITITKAKFKLTQVNKLNDSFNHQSTNTRQTTSTSAQSKQEVKVIWQKAPHGGPIPRLGVTPGGRKLYHWIPGVGFPISVP